MEGDWTAVKEGENGSSWLVGNGVTVAADEADISLPPQALNLAYLEHNLYLLHPTSSAGSV